MATKSKSTAVAVKSSTAVVDIQAALTAQVAGLGDRIAAPTGINIRITQDKQFALPSGQKTDQLQLVIVDFVARNDFYETAFDKDNISPPACFAIGSNPKALVPSKNSPAKQSDECSDCPMNAFGSAGKGKACKNGYILAVLPPEADADTPIWTIKVSPTGLRTFESFVRTTANTFRCPPVGVVTTISFDERQDYPTLVFTDAVPNENLSEHFGRQEEAKKLVMAEPDVSAYKPVKVVPLRGRAAATAKR